MSKLVLAASLAVATLSVISSSQAARTSDAAGLSGSSSSTLQYTAGGFIDYQTGSFTLNRSGLEAGIVVYSNAAAPSAPTGAFSQTNANNPIFGDDLNLTSAGVLEEFTFSVFNPSTSSGNITGASAAFKFYDQTVPAPSTATPLGSFTSNLNGFFTANPLQPGFFTTLTVTGLSSLNINLLSQITVTQQLSSVVGGTSNGVVLANPVAVGSSPATYMYIFSGAIPEGFYNLNPAGTVANPMYSVAITPEPATLSLLAGVGLVALRRKSR